MGLSLGVFDAGEFGEAALELRTAATVWARMDPADPRRSRIRQDLNALNLEIGEMLRKHNLTDGAARALREAGDILNRDGTPATARPATPAPGDTGADPR